MTRVVLALLLCAIMTAEEYQGYIGEWVTVEATAYSPHDRRDAAYRATKGRDRWMTAGRVSDVRKHPYGVAAPQPGGDRPLPPHLTLPLRTEVIIPLGNGYLDHTAGHDTAAGRVFLVDDTGGDITTNTRKTRTLHIDLRVKLEADALQFNGGAGRGRFRIFVITGPAPRHEPPQQRAVAPPPPPLDTSRSPVSPPLDTSPALLTTPVAAPVQKAVARPEDTSYDTAQMVSVAPGLLLILIFLAIIIRRRL